MAGKHIIGGSVIDDAHPLATEDDSAALASVAHSKVDVAATSTLVIAANSARRYLLLVNRGDADIVIHLGGEAVAATDLPIGAGGAYELARQFGNLFLGDIYAIHAGTGTKPVAVIEGS